MVEGKDSAALALVDDALEKLGRARLSMDLAGDLLKQSKAAIDTAGDKVAAAANELREFARSIQQQRA